MRHIFIADAHLRSPQDRNYRMMLDFLKGLEGTTDTLFVLGDLFEFWIGHPYPHYLPVLDALRSLRESGVSIVYFEGNHDFHMGQFFDKTLQAEVHPGPAVVSLEGKRVFLCHGDEMNKRDYAYRLLRFVFHSRGTRILSSVVPPSVPCRIAESLGRKSRKSHGEKRQKWDYAAIARSFAAERFAEGCDVVVTGHFHMPFLDQPSSDLKRVLVSLGDWLTHFTYAEWTDGTIRLRHYTP